MAIVSYSNPLSALNMLRPVLLHEVSNKEVVKNNRITDVLLYPFIEYLLRIVYKSTLLIQISSYFKTKLRICDKKKRMLFTSSFRIILLMKFFSMNAHRFRDRLNLIFSSPRLSKRRKYNQEQTEQATTQPTLPTT